MTRLAAVRPWRRDTERAREAGVTLVELMVSMVIVSIAVAATFALGFSLSNSYREHRRVMKVERAARGSMNVVAKALRGASPGVPSGNIEDLVGCTTFGGLRITNHTDQPDEVEVIHPAGGVLTSLRAAYTDSSTTMTVLDGSGFQPGDYALLTNVTQGALVEITNVQDLGSEWQLTTPTPSGACGGANFPSGGYAAGTLVLRARMSHFYVDESYAAPVLMLDPDGEGPLEGEPLAEGIEDLQIAVGVDLNDDGALFEDGSTTDEWFYNNPGDGAPPALATRPPRAFRVTLIARSVGEVSQQATSLRPAAEDRAGATAGDPFRRRVLSTTLEIRNLEGSP